MIKRRAKPSDIKAFVVYATGFTSDCCLRWPFGRNGAGYGHFTINGAWVLAHRVVCEAVNGPAPDAAAEASHSCGNGHEGCVNPRHLSWKSRAGNAADMVEHGRSLRGRKHPLAKLTAEAVGYIRANPEISNRDGARMFGVSPAAIRLARVGKSWAWVGGVVFHEQEAA